MTLDRQIGDIPENQTQPNGDFPSTARTRACRNEWHADTDQTDQRSGRQGVGNRGQ